MAKNQNDFFELYKHPKWQKRRLEIMKKAKFECEDCGSRDENLNIHHGYYQKGLKPWEYPDESLHCLCLSCHSNFETKLKLLKTKISKVSISSIDEIIGFVDGLIIEENECDVCEVYSYEHAEGIGKYFRLSVDEIIETKELTKGLGLSVFDIGYTQMIKLKINLK